MTLPMHESLICTVVPHAAATDTDQCSPGATLAVVQPAINYLLLVHSQHTVKCSEPKRETGRTCCAECVYSATADATGRHCAGLVKPLVKYTYICIALYNDSSLKRSDMVRVNDGSHSFTCHPHVYPQVE